MIEKLQPDQETFIEDVRVRHPARTSRCGALLAELSHPESTDRTRSALLLGHFSCKRGLRVLDRLCTETYGRIMASQAEWGEFPVGDARSLLSALLWAVARMDTSASHAVLVRVLSEFENVHLRADVVEMMAFERAYFERDIVVPLLDPETAEPLLLSALYAMCFRADQIGSRSEVRRVAYPLLQHASGGVRSYTVQMLTWDKQHLREIAKLANDPDPHVRDAVEFARTF